MKHKHAIRKTHVIIHDVGDYPTIYRNDKQFYEGKTEISKDSPLKFDFEYCIGCGLRMLNGQPIITKGILDDFETIASYAKANAPSHINREEITMQHSDFEALKQKIEKALELSRK